MNSIQRLSLLAAAVAGLTGCAVSRQDVLQEADKRRAVIVAAQEAIQAQPKQPTKRLTRIQGNYLGGQTLTVSHSLALPPQARDVFLNFGQGATGSLDDAARNIRSVTGIPVRINPDVIGRGVAAMPPPATVGQAGVPLPGSPLPSVAPAAAPVQRRTGELPMYFKGDLGDYLNMLAGALGINWEYANGEIHFFRRVTRTFNVMVTPGSVQFRDEVNSSGASSGGGTAQTSQAGIFGSNSQAATQANYSPWESIEASIKSMVSPEGRYTVSQASGTVVVTDNKEVVDRISEWIKGENAVLTRQVAIEVREIAVEVRNDAQVGIDLNLVYQRLNQASGNQDWVFRMAAPSSLADSSAGAMGFNIARPDAKLAGSNFAIQALNSLGNIVHDSTRTVVTTNRVPGRLQDVTDRAYLAETIPAAGGSTGSTGPGVPGLKPGVVTYGDNLILLPTIGDNNAVMLSLFLQRSTLLELNSQSAGAGATFQQINTPVLARKKNAQNFQLQQGDTLVVVGNNSESWTARDAHSVTGGSRVATQVRVLSVLLVTPRILPGV